MIETEGELPRDLALGSFEPRRIEGGFELRSERVSGYQGARIARGLGLAAALLAPVVLRAEQDAFTLGLFASFGVFVASFAGMIANVTHGSFGSGAYRRVDRTLAVRWFQPGGYRERAEPTVRIEVDGRLLSTTLPRRVVVSWSPVVTKMNRVLVTRTFHHVTLVERARVVRVARFEENAETAWNFAKALADALGLPAPTRRDESAFESSDVGMYGFAFAAVGEVCGFAIVGALIAPLAWLGAPWMRVEVAVLAWLGLHCAVQWVLARWGQRQLTALAIETFGIDPHHE